MNNLANLEVYTSENFNQEITNKILSVISESLTTQEVCRIALAGGSTPAKIYQLITEAEQSKEVNWSQVKFFLGDERFTDDLDQQNASLVTKTLLKLVPVENFFPINQTLNSSEAAAEEYQQALAMEFALEQGQSPKFDLILLGIGNDGHTASLFPGEKILKNFQDLVSTAIAPVEPKERVSMTYPVLINAKKIFFIIAGESKAEVAQEIINIPDEAGYPSCFYPIAKGEVSFLLDQAAANKLSQ